MRFPIRTKLILAICLPLLPVYLVVLGIDYHAGQEQAIAQMKNHLTEATARLAGEIDQELAVASQTVLNAAALMTQVPVQEQSQLDALLRSNVRDTPGVYGAAVAFEPRAFQPHQERSARYVYRSATAAALTVTDITYDYTRWDWYLLPKLLDQVAWTDPYYDEGAGNVLMCTCSAPFYRNEMFQGVVTVDISLDHLRERLRQVDIREGYRLIVSRTGTFVSHPNESLIMGESIFSLGQWHQSPELVALGHEMTAGRKGVRRLLEVESGEPVWVVFVPIPSVGWSVAAVIPDAEVMADVYAELNLRAGLLLAGLAAIVALILLVAAWITRPITRLAAAAQELARGNLEVRLPAMQSRDEIGEFAATFNKMVHDLQGTIDQRLCETAAREALERELQVARQIQTSLMPMTRPPFPDRTEFTLEAFTEPAKIMAGDFFDFWFVDRDVLALVVADVSGKGVPAAMFMAVARTILRSFSSPTQTPAQVLTIADRIMAAENDEQMFVTVFHAHYHVKTGELMFANGGHNPPYLVRKDGVVTSTGSSTGPIVGVWGDAEFEDRRIRLDPGSTLIAFTDGVTEAQNAQGELFGEARLEQLLSAIHGEPVDEIRRRILDEVNEYRESKDQDDVTFLALRRSESDL
jgi:sigma-B regulation protein RsbU (phosphoserine phosphatase)